MGTNGNITRELIRLRREMEKFANCIFSDNKNMEEKAMDLVYQAWDETSPKRAVELIEEALRLDPQNADAYNVLANIALEEWELGLAEDFYKIALNKSIQALGGEEKISRKYYAFWGELKTRPFMRAMHGLGLVYLEKEEYEKACSIFEKMLKLNPNDNQGIRFLLGGVYCMLKRPKKLFALDRKYASYEPHHLFNLAYGYFLVKDLKKMFKTLRVAFLSNIYIAPLLLGERVKEEEMWHFSNLEELDYAEDYVYLWGKLWDDKEASFYLQSLWGHPKVQEVLDEYKRLGRELLVMSKKRDIDRRKWMEIIEEMEKLKLKQLFNYNIILEEVERAKYKRSR